MYVADDALNLPVFEIKHLKLTFPIFYAKLKAPPNNLVQLPKSEPGNVHYC